MTCRRVQPVCGESKKMGAKVYNTAYSQMVTQSGTDAAQQNLTSVIGREAVLSLWCGRRRKKRVKNCLAAWTLAGVS